MPKIVQVKSVEHLKTLASGEDGAEFFIALNFGMRSSKRICWDEPTKSWCITNDIDDSHEDLEEEELATATNIVKAISRGTLYHVLRWH